jgi:hypothetical protein
MAGYVKSEGNMNITIFFVIILATRSSIGDVRRNPEHQFGINVLMDSVTGGCNYNDPDLP